MTATPVRRFVDGAESKDGAYTTAALMARALVRAGLTARYGVSVHRIPVSRIESGWGVWVTDREPDQPPPAAAATLLPSVRAAA